MSLVDISSAFRWWLVLLGIGWLAFPLTYLLFGRLPDKGIAFTKMVGLLLVSYLFWLGGCLGFLNNSLGGIILATVVIGALSWWATYYYQLSWFSWLQVHKNQVLITELVFLSLFALWVWVRAQNPSITATEKPMEFAFLNSVGISASFPPLDPWLSGYAISYYYFGYIMTSVLVRLASVSTPVAFNLGIAWLAAGTGTAAFGLVYNLVQLESPTVTKLKNRAVVFGLIAALAIPLAGNLEILLEVLHGNGIGSDAFWLALDVRDLTGPATDAPRYEGGNWWWWRSSRVINEYHLSDRNEEGLIPIAEFPGFSFVLGDMHPHVLALPFALLSLAVGLAWWRDDKLQQWQWRSGHGGASLKQLYTYPLFIFTVIVLGGLSFLNTWDVLIHLFVIVGAYTLSHWQRLGAWSWTLIKHALLMGLLLALPAFFLYLPFYVGFSSQAGAPYLLPFLMRPTRLLQFMVIFGMPLLSITVFLLVLGVKAKLSYWFAGIRTALTLIAALFVLMFCLGWLIASSPAGAYPVVNLASELNIVLPALDANPSTLARMGWGLTVVTQLMGKVLAVRWQYAGLTLFLGGMVVLVIAIAHLYFSQDREEPIAWLPSSRTSVLPFVLLLILTGTLLTLGPEFVYLRDNFGQRMNTIFKFYYQAWVMFGIAGIFATNYLLERVPPIGVPTATGYLALFAVSLLFPFYAVQSRSIEYRGSQQATTRREPTLNGLAYIEQSNPDEYEALLWLRTQKGTPVLLEAVGGQYSSYGRISSNTGFPTVIGWAGHEYQWRGGGHPEPGRREGLVEEIYKQTAWTNIPTLLNEFNVTYVYVGNLEIIEYGREGLAKFEQNMPVVFRNATVTIYQWQGEQ